jgi:hypothetical protein
VRTDHFYGSSPSLQEIDLYLFPGSTLVWVGVIVRQASQDRFTMPFGDGHLGLIRCDPIPQRLDVFDLVLDGHLVESWRRQRGGATHRDERSMGLTNAPLDGLAEPSRLRFMTLKARVRAGRLVVDEPTDLPEGTELELLPLDPGDWLDDADRAALHDALRQSDGDLEAGRLVSAEDVLRELRSP